MQNVAAGARLRERTARRTRAARAGAGGWVSSYLYIDRSRARRRLQRARRGAARRRWGGAKIWGVYQFLRSLQRGRSRQAPPKFGALIFLEDHCRGDLGVGFSLHGGMAAWGFPHRGFPYGVVFSPRGSSLRRAFPTIAGEFPYGGDPYTYRPVACVVFPTGAVWGFPYALERGGVGKKLRSFGMDLDRYRS